MSSFKKDIAPGEPHIALRRKGVSYYVPSLFHLAPTHQKIVPLLIRDVIRAKNPLEIYGPRGLKVNQEGYILVKNHPIKTLKIFGRLMSFSTHNYPGFHGGDDYEFFSLFIDDSSGEKSEICAKVFPDIIRSEQLEGQFLVEVTGTVATNREGVKEISASEVKILGRTNDIAVELAWWASALNTRKFLARPWIYIPPELNAYHQLPKVVFDPRDLSVRSQKKTILRSTTTEDEVMEVAQDYSATDSFAIYPTRYISGEEARQSSEICTSLQSKDSGELDAEAFSKSLDFDRAKVVEIADL